MSGEGDTTTDGTPAVEGSGADASTEASVPSDIEAASTPGAELRGTQEVLANVGLDRRDLSNDPAAFEQYQRAVNSPMIQDRIFSKMEQIEEGTEGKLGLDGKPIRFDDATEAAETTEIGVSWRNFHSDPTAREFPSGPTAEDTVRR